MDERGLIGVPIDEATANDFMQVRAALVRRVGGADQALVWSRIYYRCDKNSRVADERDGVHWWKASHSALAEETGLSEKQARTAVDSLVADGFLVRNVFEGRTFSYRPVTYLPISADTESAQSGRSIRPMRQMHLPTSAVAPLIETEKTEDISLSPDESDDATLISADWRPNQSHIDKAASLHLDVRNEYQRFRAHAEREHRRLKSWNAGFTNWLRKSAEFAQKRGGVPLPSTRQSPDDRVREGMERGARLQALVDAEQRGIAS